MHIVYIALGTNLGDRPANLNAALDAMPPDVTVIGKSPVYETPPWGYLHQEAFLNQVAKIETHLEPLELLGFLKKIEKTLGRKASIMYGPRLIDLDILFYDNLVYETKNLAIPHPHIQDRAFVLVPLADLAPDLCHPVVKQTISELVKEVDVKEIELYYVEEDLPFADTDC